MRGVEQNHLLVSRRHAEHPKQRIFALCYLYQLRIPADVFLRFLHQAERRNPFILLLQPGNFRDNLLARPGSR